MPLDAVLSEPQVDNADGVVLNLTADADAAETQDWLDALDAVIETAGPQRATYLLTRLQMEAHRHGVRTPGGYNTPFINTIPAEDEPPYPGDRKIERDLKSLVRWNAMATVARGHNGGHISTYASAATLYEVGYNHFFHGPSGVNGGDQIYIQGHASPGIYARAYLAGRLTEKDLENFRKE